MTLNIRVDGQSKMEVAVASVRDAYEALTISSKVLDDNGKIPTWGFGRNTSHDSIGPPSVFWIPVSGTFEAPKTVGGEFNEDGDQKPASIIDRVISFEVQLNGRTYEETEKLIESVIVATATGGGGYAIPTDESWPTESEAGHDKALMKHLAVLNLQLRLPVIEEEPGTSVVTDQGHTEELIPLEC